MTWWMNRVQIFCTVHHTPWYNLQRVHFSCKKSCNSQAICAKIRWMLCYMNNTATACQLSILRCSHKTAWLHTYRLHIGCCLSRSKATALLAAVEHWQLGLPVFETHGYPLAQTIYCVSVKLLYKCINNTTNQAVTVQKHTSYTNVISFKLALLIHMVHMSGRSPSLVIDAVMPISWEFIQTVVNYCSTDTTYSIVPRTLGVSLGKWDSASLDPLFEISLSLRISENDQLPKLLNAIFKSWYFTYIVAQVFLNFLLYVADFRTTRPAQLNVRFAPGM